MQPKLQYWAKVLEQQHEKIIELVRPLPEAKFFNRVGGKWSISQILTHLMEAEKASLRYMQKKSQGIPQLGNTGLTEEIKSVVLNVSQRLPLKFKAPQTVLQAEPEVRDLATIEKDWRILHQELNHFLEQFDRDSLRQKVYKHAVAGRLNIIHALSFLKEHRNHHLPQIKRLL